MLLHVCIDSFVLCTFANMLTTVVRANIPVLRSIFLTPADKYTSRTQATNSHTMNSASTSVQVTDERFSEFTKSKINGGTLQNLYRVWVNH